MSLTKCFVKKQQVLLGMIWSTSGFSDPTKVRAEYRKNAQESIQQLDRASQDWYWRGDWFTAEHCAEDNKSTWYALSFGFGGKKIKPFPATDVLIHNIKWLLNNGHGVFSKHLALLYYWGLESSAKTYRPYNAQYTYYCVYIYIYIAGFQNFFTCKIPSEHSVCSVSNLVFKTGITK